jgi:hypothetical protein
VDEPDRTSAREARQALDEGARHPRRIRRPREPRRPRELGQAESLVVPSRADGVDLARAPFAVFPEKEIDPREDCVIAARSRCGGESDGTRGEPVESAFLRVVVSA